MLDQNLHAHQHETDTADEDRLGFISEAEYVAHFHACGGETEGGDSDESGGREDVHVQECEGDTHGQCVDAGGHGQWNMDLKPTELSTSSSSSERASRIMPMPMMERSTKANQ